MNWHIGQEIVAVKNHSEGDFKSGDEFIILSLRGGICKCSSVLIDIGLTTPKVNSWCKQHQNPFPNGGIKWVVETCFAPKQTLTESEEAYIKEFIEEVDSIPVENLFER